eukprot:GHRQ01025431.1.p3 GENE.GHRQ01025431.1~~GHRQ01025431.1.p3  ORF type:complete len:142 (+),score=11.79 GHRQ01025431.1:1899-2324(+)
MSRKHCNVQHPGHKGETVHTVMLSRVLRKYIACITACTRHPASINPTALSKASALKHYVVSSRTCQARTLPGGLADQHKHTALLFQQSMAAWFAAFQARCRLPSRQLNACTWCSRPTSSRAGHQQWHPALNQTIATLTVIS